MKKIRIRFTDMPHEFDLHNNYVTNILRQHYELEFSETPDFLFYSCFGFDHFRFPNCVKIFLCGEPVIPNFNDCDYAIGYVYLDFGNRYHRAAYAFASAEGKEIPKSVQDRSTIDAKLAKRKFCNFIYSNEAKGEGAVLRTKFCKALKKYKQVDCPGPVLHNMNVDIPRYVTREDGKYGVFSSDWQHSKRAFQAQYKFSIAFESTLLPGMLSDKMADPIIAQSVPIYWGNPDVVREMNPKAFINCHDYHDDIDAVVRRVKELDQDEEQYLEMLRQKPFLDDYDFHQERKLAEFLFDIIEKGNVPVRSINAVEIFPAISAQSLALHVPHVEEEDVVQAIIDYHSNTHALVKKIQHFGTTPVGKFFRYLFRGLHKSQKPLNSHIESSNHNLSENKNQESEDDYDE